MSNQYSSRKVKEALAEQRKQLKFELFAQRLTRGHHHFAPLCAYCGHPMPRAYWIVMHEWLIKRSALPIALQHLIMTEENCVLVDHSCHEKYGQTVRFKLRCAEAQYARYGRHHIIKWVESLALKQAVWIPTEEEIDSAKEKDRKTHQ